MWAHTRKCFLSVKAELTQPTVLALYNPEAETKITAGSSSYVLGAVLLQRQKVTNNWRPIAHTSRSLTGAETCYAQIEKEALACTWVCENM